MVRRVIASPLAEWTFLAGLAGIGEALDDDLCVRRVRQTGDLALDHVDRLALDAADVVVLTDTRGHLDGRAEEERWVMAEGHHHRHRLAAREVGVAHDAPVL